MSPARPLRILFFLGGPSYCVRQYATLISELAARGHEVHLAFQRSKGGLPEPALRALAEQGVRVGYAPEREPTDPWRRVAWLVRALGDLARYAHPRYERASILRTRIARKTLRHLQTEDGFEPIARRLALRLARRLTAGSDAALSERVISVARRLEAAIPSSDRIERYLAERAPDVVLATPVVNRASTQVDLLKSARALGIPTGICVASWDNLTNKGLLKFVPERVFVWNEAQRREAVELHGIPPERVVATGAQLFDEWFARRPSTERAEFLRRVRLDPGRPYVLYTCSNPAMTSAHESAFVADWVEAIRSAPDAAVRAVGIVVRPHPNDEGEWRALEPGRYEHVVVWPPAGALPVTDETRGDFFDSLVHSAAVVGINTTAMIEAAIVGRSVLTVLAPEFAQESTLHFDYLLEENGGFLHVASSLDEHVAQLGRVLAAGAGDEERRRRFVASFVRPHGLERPATPILADAVEELAGLPVGRRASLDAVLLRPLLALEASLTRLAAGLPDLELARRRRRAAKRLRRAARLVVLRARRAGVTLARSEGR